MMEINEEKKAICRRAGISDISALFGYRVRFLNELYNYQKKTLKTAVVRESLQDHLSPMG
jgi:hypothetical protein